MLKCEVRGLRVFGAGLVGILGVEKVSVMTLMRQTLRLCCVEISRHETRHPGQLGETRAVMSIQYPVILGVRGLHMKYIFYITMFWGYISNVNLVWTDEHGKGPTNQRNEDKFSQKLPKTKAFMIDRQWFWFLGKDQFSNIKCRQCAHKLNSSNPFIIDIICD